MPYKILPISYINYTRFYVLKSCVATILVAMQLCKKERKLSFILSHMKEKLLLLNLPLYIASDMAAWVGVHGLKKEVTYI